ncbi:MAG: hypothetical protein Q7S98_02045, partial [Deltaproteobacteria bacterium]|nr:hypothetical protein [Deltaproteobacteria bacterium]
IDYNNVSRYLPRPLRVAVRDSRHPINVDVANLILNLKPGGFMTGAEFSDFAIDHDVLPIGYDAYRLHDFRNDFPVMERQPDGSWQLRNPSSDNDSGPAGGGEINYRASVDETTRPDDGSELLGVHSGEIVLSVPSDMVRGGLELNRGIAPEVSGAFENNLTRLPPRPLVLP